VTAARLLAIMGSGETSPTMVKTHRALLDRLAGPAVLLDTPFGFQENADDIAARAVAYFAESVGRGIEVARYRAATDDALARETAFARVRGASYVFAGPGSPSYALRHWQESPIPELLANKLRDGGGICFSSAAALTLGVATVPVYEVYKVGEEPVWLEGLNLLAAAGLRAAVIPHFDNAEGGNHDTRYCYLGERRLRLLEAQLPDDAFVLGVDEHTACVIDLDANTVEISGLGAVTVRRQGEQRRFGAGETIPLSELDSSAGDWSAVSAVPTTATAEQSPLLAVAGRLEATFDAALAANDVAAACSAVLALDDELAKWSADTLQSDEPDQVRNLLRSMLVRLAQMATATALRADLVAPLVEELLATRTAARVDERFAEADAIRDRLAALGVEVMDERAGPSWRLTS
jgi:hypothetical protein